MDFRLLGPVEIWAGDRVVNAGEPRRRAVLAALLFDAGVVVPSGTLIDRVWGEDPPARVVKTLGTHITRIRRVLEQAAGGDEPVVLSSQMGGYRLAVDRDLVDLHRFRGLVTDARDPALAADRRVGLLREAIALWRGEPLIGIPGDWAGRVREHLDRERLDALAAWADAELAVGNSAAVLAPLTELAGEHPMMEPLTLALMRALVAAGRPGEALERCRAHRLRLIEEQGIEQGPRLRDLYDEILRDDQRPAHPGDGRRSDPKAAPAAPTREAPPAGAAPAAQASPAGAAGSPVAPVPPEVLPRARRRPSRRVATLAGLLTAALALGAVVVSTVANRPDDRPAEGAAGAGTPIAAEDFAGDALDTKEWAPYTMERLNGSAWSPGMVRVNGGELQVVGNGRNPTGKGNVAGGTCWCVSETLVRTYGRWQVHAKFDQGAGYGPVIGLYPDSDAPEKDGLLTLVRIDQPSRTSMYPEVWDSAGGHIDVSPTVGDFTNWATYEIEWRPEFIRMSVDGKPYFDSRQSPEPVAIPSEPMFLYVQLVPGPDGPVPAPDRDTPSQVVVHVDWTKVFA